MNKSQLIEYLKTWADLHAREVYGSPREYLPVWELRNELDRISDSEVSS